MTADHSATEVFGRRLRTQRGRGPRSRLPALLASALSLWGLGCGIDDDSSPEERYARRALPIDRRWIPESDVPRMPEKGHRMVIWEVSVHPPGTIATPEQQRAAQELIERAHQAVLAHGWHDHDEALADGFYRMPNDRGHFQNDEFMLDDRILDPDRPEFLMFYPTPRGMALTGMMFLMGSREARGPQVGGPLTVWHYHRWRRPHCYRDGAILVGLAQRGRGCLEGEAHTRSPEMLHVWLVDRPDGPFATAMKLDASRVPELLAKRMRERGY